MCTVFCSKQYTEQKTVHMQKNRQFYKNMFLSCIFVISYCLSFSHLSVSGLSLPPSFPSFLFRAPPLPPFLPSAPPSSSLLSSLSQRRVVVTSVKLVLCKCGETNVRDWIPLHEIMYFFFLFDRFLPFCSPSKMCRRLVLMFGALLFDCFFIFFLLKKNAFIHGYSTNSYAYLR